MSSTTFFSANRIQRDQDLAFGGVADTEVATLYAVRFTTCPDNFDAGGAIDTTFTPVAVTNDLNFWFAAISQLKLNAASIIWNVAPIDATHAGWGFYDDPVLRGPAHLVTVSRFSAPEITSAGFPPYVSPNDFSLRVKNQSARIFPGDYLSNKLLDHRLGRVAFTPAANLTRRTYTVAPDAEGMGATESTYTGYVPQTDANNLTTWSLSSARTKSNAIALFGSFSTSSESTAACAFWDGANLYLVCKNAVPLSLTAGHRPKIAAGAIAWTESAS